MTTSRLGQRQAWGPALRRLLEVSADPARSVLRVLYGITSPTDEQLDRAWQDIHQSAYFAQQILTAQARHPGSAEQWLDEQRAKGWYLSDADHNAWKDRVAQERVRARKARRRHPIRAFAVWRHRRSERRYRMRLENQQDPFFREERRAHLRRAYYWTLVIALALSIAIPVAMRLMSSLAAAGAPGIPWFD